jgi:tetratricopeptide (TPR) repeat protein
MGLVILCLLALFAFLLVLLQSSTQLNFNNAFEKLLNVNLYSFPEKDRVTTYVHRHGVYQCRYSIMLMGVLCITCSSKQTENTQSTSIALCTTNTSASIEGLERLPAPQYRNNIGNSHLSITTQNPGTQRWFDHGINHLHGFWHLEAYRAFKEVIKLDPNCAMGYCGLALCQPGFSGNNKIWEDAINQAVDKSKNTSKFEQAFIEATEVLVKKGIAEAQNPFRSLYKTFPDEPEAIAFAAIMLRQHESEATQQEVKKILEASLKRFPDNVALMHYYIHIMELRPEFAQAKSIATKMINMAPNAPHLLHMPGHLYYLAGEYHKAIETYERALKFETEYHQSEKIPFLANQNYLHNLQFLAVAQAETGNQELTIKTAQRLANLNLQSEIPNEGASLMYHYEGRILPALVYLRYRNWEKAIEVFSIALNKLDKPINNPMVRMYYEVMKLYAQAMKALEANKIDDAVQLGGQLSQLMTQFEKQGLSYQNRPEFKSINETYDIMSMARYELAGWIDNMDVTKPFNDAAWKVAIDLQNAIKYDEPPRLMYPIEESMMRLHLKRGDKQAAKAAQQQALKRRTNSPMILALK